MTQALSFISRRAALRGVAALGVAPLAARAQAWPAKPIRITVAYPPGGVADAMARLLADKLAPVLGQSVVVDNKAGASGSIGMDAVAKSAPDGSAFAFSAISPLVLNPHLGKSPFDPARDIVPVVSVIASPVLLLGTSALAAKDFRELVAAAKARPGALRWATSGPASLGHIVLEQVKAGTGVDITHIPYKGGGQQINDALGGQFEVLSVNAGPAVMGHLKAGSQPGVCVRAVRPRGHAVRGGRAHQCRGQPAAEGQGRAAKNRRRRQPAHRRERGRIRQIHRHRIGEQRAHHQGGGHHGRFMNAFILIAVRAWAASATSHFYS